MTFDPTTEAATMNGSPKKHKANGKPSAPIAEPIEQTVLIEVPIGDLSAGYITDRLDLTSMTTSQAEALNRLTAGLREKNARCQRRDARTGLGIVVDKEVDAIRWILDQLANGMIVSI